MDVKYNIRVSLSVAHTFSYGSTRTRDELCTFIVVLELKTVGKTNIAFIKSKQY